MGKNRKGGKGKGRSYQPKKPDVVYDGPLPTFEWNSAPIAELSPELKQQVDGWSEKLTECVGEDYKKHLEHQLLSTVQQLPAITDTAQIQRLLDFYTRHPNVYTTEESWKQPVTNNKFVGKGFKICSSTGKRLWGGDDGVYRTNPMLQEYLPRGCVIVQNENGSSPAIGIFGNRKFYGRSSGDDDESDLTSEAIRRGSYTQFLISNKANGESCHVSLNPADSSTWIIGSKNRKIAVSNKSQIQLYKKEQFYGMATEMAEVFFGVLELMGPEKERELKQLLDLTKWTLNFEFEYPAHQHIVPLEKAQLVMIGCSGIHVPCGKASHPILGCAIARYFHFPSVLEDLTVHPKDKLDSICYNTAREWNTEGAVLILLDNDHNVVDFVKVKSWWYILLRSIREKIRRINGAETVSACCMGIIKRIGVLKNSMNIDAVYANCFTKYGTAFAEWLGHEVDGKMPRLESAMDLYPVLWLEFLEQNNLPKDPTLLESAKEDAGSSEKYAKYARYNLPLMILMQGIPGIGKSYLASKLAEKLNQEGISTKDVAQDDFVKEAGQKRSGKACMAFIRNALVTRKYQCIILARNNANVQQYQNYVNFDSEGLCRVLFICPKELSTRLNEAVMMSVASVLHRKERSAEDHPTDSMDIAALASLPLKFFGEMKIHQSAFPVSIMKDEALPIPNPSKFEQLLTRFKAKGFRSPDVSSDDLRVLGLDDKRELQKYIDCRRDINDVTNDCYKFIRQLITKSTPLPGSYFGITLRSECSNQLVEFAQSFFPEGNIPKEWNLHSDHVTLMHSNSYFTSPKMIDKWEKLGEHAGIQATITPKIMLVNDRIATMKVSVSTDAGLSLDKYVTSKVPHVTIACAPRVSAFSSIAELSQTQGGVEISEPVLYGLLSLVESSQRK